MWLVFLTSEINVVCCIGSVQIQIEYKKVGVLPIRIVKSNVSSVCPSSERVFQREGSMLETLDFTYP